MLGFFRRIAGKPGNMAEPPTEAAADRLIEAGLACQQREDFSAALGHFRAAQGQLPEYWRASLCVGNAHYLGGNLAAARTAYQRAHELAPEHAGICFNLGRVQAELGDKTGGERFLREALRLKPEHVDAMVVLADLLEGSGRADEGLAWLDRALALEPDHAGIQYNKCLCLEGLGRTDEAEQAMLRLLELDPGQRMALYKLAYHAKERGEVARAVGFLARALDIGFDCDMCGDYLMLLLYLDGLDQQKLLAEHRRYQRWLDGHPQLALPARPLPRKRLRIGLLSPDFCRHPVAFFIEPVMAHLDRERFEVLAYSSCDIRDEATDRLRPHCEVWRDIHGVDAETAARLIAVDGVDILIDLAGHTGHNRLDVVAFKPAPVVATWLGYLATTGLDAVDYRIVDIKTDPPGLTESHHSECLIRLPHTQWCYQPQHLELPVTPLPALSKGYVTFASFNQLIKVSDRALDLWFSLLRALPGSRLLVAAASSQAARERIMRRLVAQGIAPERIEFAEKMDFESYLKAYGRVDVVLDSMPFSGGTTTCDALFMGVPVLTLSGTHSVSRSATSLMASVGLNEWIASTPEDFVGRGVELCGRIDVLAALRAGLRERFLASPIGDQAAFAKDFATILETMWAEAGPRPAATGAH